MRLIKFHLKLSEMGNSQKGFTLVELLVVIGVLGVLATGLLIAINPAAQLSKARDATRKSSLKQIRGALERYRLANGQYPPAGSCAYNTNCYVYSSGGSNWIPALVTSGELKTIPVDPLNTGGAPWVDGNYRFSYGNVYTDVHRYDLTAQLENRSDPDRCELKQWILQINNTSWCGSYSRYIYAPGPGE